MDILVYENDMDLRHECGFLKIDFNCLCLEIKEILMQQKEG